MTIEQTENFGLFLDELTLRNFKSFGNADTVIDLKQTGTTHVLGYNKDINSKNGCGKTTMMDAISFALFDTPISNISKANLVNYINGSKATEMMVSLKFRVNGQGYTITRWYGAKSDYELVKDGESNPVTKAGQHDFNREIVELIGMSYRLFRLIMVFRRSSFFDLEAKERRPLIEELLNVNRLGDKAAKLRELIKTTKSDIAIQEAIIATQRSAADTWKSNVENATNRLTAWDTNHDITLANIQNELKAFDGIDFAAELEKLNQLPTIDANITGITNDISHIERGLRTAQQDHNTTESNITQLENFVASIEGVDFAAEAINIAKVSEINTTLMEINSKINGVVTEYNTKVNEQNRLVNECQTLMQNSCPYCGQHYAGAVEKLRGHEATITGLMETINALMTSKTELDTNAKLAGEALSAIPPCKFTSVEQINTTKQQIDAAKTNIEALSLILVELKGSVALMTADLATKQQDLINTKASRDQIVGGGKFNSIHTLQTKQQEYMRLVSRHEAEVAQINPFHATIEILTGQGEPKVDTDALDALNSTLVHQNHLLKLLTRDDSFIRRRIINRNISYLNSRIAHYANGFGLHHRVEFETNMDIIIRDVDHMLDYGNMSGGEQVRLDTAISWAFRDLRMHLKQSINCLFIDEIDGGSLCEQGVSDLLRMIKQKAREDNIGIWVITHRPEALGRFDREITMVKHQGFTSMIEGRHEAITS